MQWPFKFDSGILYILRNYKKILNKKGVRLWKRF